MGFKGSGKDSTANVLNEYGFVSLSFAETLKQCLSVIFGWDIELLNGHTKESRIWRDQVDNWWSERLGIPDFTPRKALTMIGTDLFRKHFDEMIWIYSLCNKINSITSDVVITDIRFKNEYNVIMSYDNAQVYRVKREQPDWEDIGYLASLGDEDAIRKMEQLDVHVSEWEWLSCPVNDVIDNSGSFAQLAVEVERVLRNSNQNNTRFDPNS